MIPVTTFADKTVAVFGLGGSGIATARALIAGGATVAAWDDGEQGRNAATAANLPLVDLSTADWSTFAALVLAPGVPLTHPEPHWTVHKAKAAGIEIIGDIELFCRERNAHAPNAPFIAITGTNGKSTTTSLIAHILRNAGMDVQMGGNIGVPILALDPPANDRFNVIEMSSFQIDLLKRDPTTGVLANFRPTVGVLLNITPDHLDRHGPDDDLDLAMKNYAAIKRCLIESSIISVVGREATRWLSSPSFMSADRTLSYTPQIIVSGMQEADIQVQDGLLKRGPSKTIVADIRDVPTLRGAHNEQNAGAATAAAFAVVELFGLSDEAIAEHMRTYPGLAHRMEEIGRIGPILLINDSKATNADSTQKALLSFPENVYWILGGKPKEGGIEPLRPYFKGIAKAYLIGAATEEFAQTLDGHVPYERCVTLDVAVARAVAGATSLSSPDTGEDARRAGEGLDPALSADGVAREKQSQPVILLSPACASYDQFRSFEHRGDAFRALVSALPGFTPRAKA